MDDSLFAEIEIGEKQGDNPRGGEGSSALLSFRETKQENRPPAFLAFCCEAASEPIKPRKIDPLRERFYEMRRLASQRPFSRNDSELFYRQARFMEDFSDDYEHEAHFNMYYPYYQHMGYEYLRTYFTWRTRVRQGEIRPISVSYIFLYIYELLSGIGVDSPMDGLNKLLEIWNVFSGDNSSIEKYLSKWFRDYHVFYELPHSFADFAQEHGLQKYYSLTFLFEEKQGDGSSALFHEKTTKQKNRPLAFLELWNSISGYDVFNSRFFKDGNDGLMSDCFDAVLVAISDFCAARSTRFEDLFVYSVSRRVPWQPFKQALFGSRVRQSDREILISGFERYYCKHSQWTTNQPVFYSSQKDFIGYIIKKTESCLRSASKYKYKLAADLKPGSKPFRELQRPAAKRAELDKVIERAVADFYKDINRTVVKVDHINLARIREEALETQEQLIVSESENKADEKQGDGSSAFPSALHSQVEEPKEELTLSFADGWKALKEALTDVERKALSIALHADALNNIVSIKAFADENNIMLEVLADSINEKAADYIGDNILELDEDMILYDEYKENIAVLVT
ncbi:MAG: TerB N-terminal domain-containing protein [Oscillospiraceae bacterium]|jgi:hypothetical protein|nr:TerB N-terminal domain-containing protein [Oscillospiraceae bacterium]